MLVLSRFVDQRIVVGHRREVVIQVVDIRHSSSGLKVRIGIDAPKELPIHREEACERIDEDSKESKPDRIERMIKEADYYRKHLSSIAKEFVVLHGESAGSCEADELMHCILDGESYHNALIRVNKIRARRGREKANA
jgi:carbon storage regulator